uniref:Uncharacterized protein n=1 Tax=Anguilla anguilla TaxID=7936 RepID=A0A0E9R7A2_ANGAN
MNVTRGKLFLMSAVLGSNLTQDVSTFKGGQNKSTHPGSSKR